MLILEPSLKLHDSGVEENQQYVYEVTAIDHAGNESSPGNEAVVQVPLCDTEPPPGYYRALVSIQCFCRSRGLPEC